MRFVATILLLFALLSTLLSAAKPGDIIVNVATASYSIYKKKLKSASNKVLLKVEGTKAKIRFLLPAGGSQEQLPVAGTSFYGRDDQWHALTPFVFKSGQQLPSSKPISFIPTQLYTPEDAAIVEVIDDDRNLDLTKRERIEVNLTSPTGDVETLRLMETAPDSGIFTGYIPLAPGGKSDHDGILQIHVGDKLFVHYFDFPRALVKRSAVVAPKSKNLKVWVRKEVNKKQATIGEVLHYTIKLFSDESTDIPSWRIVDTLPPGLKYLKGTLRLDGKPIVGNLSSDGARLSIGPLLLPAKGVRTLVFDGLVGTGVVNNRLINRVYAELTASAPKSHKRFAKIASSAIDAPVLFRTSSAQAVTYLREDLYRSEGVIVGRVHRCDDPTIGIKGVRLYMEDGSYVTTDRNGRYHFERVRLGRHVVQLDTALLPQTYRPDEQNLSVRNAGRAYSQFIDMQYAGLKRVDFCLNHLKRSQKNSTTIVTEAKDIAETAMRKKSRSFPHYSVVELRRYEGKIELLWPPKHYVPPIPSIDLAFAYPKEYKATVYLNDRPVSMLNFNKRISDRTSGEVIDTYKGIDLLPQTNTVRIVLKDASGKRMKEIVRSIHVSGEAVRIEYVKSHSRPIADGKTVPVIAVRFLDTDGYPLREGVTGKFSIDAPYRSLEREKQLHNNPLASNGITENRFVVEEGGIAYIRLVPTTQAGAVTLHFKIKDRDRTIRAWLKPKMRKWIVVGLAEGTIGYDTLKGGIQNANRTGKSKGVQKKGRVSFFAKGSIRGDWLLTMAYDSGKAGAQSPFFGQIDPGKYYTVYNDASIQKYDAASRRKLYVKLEKERFSLLFGDYDTDISTTELSRYSRRFTGLKGEYHDAHTDLKLFGANSDQLFVKDELRGDGTSGLYRLSHAPLLPNSEKITIEVRDRLRPEKILERRVLQRFRDYEIDYDRGMLRFREPIYSTDGDFNPRYIVVDYEIEGIGSKHYSYGGRVLGKWFDDALEVGLTGIHEDQGVIVNRLAGADATVKLGGGTKLHAEIVRTRNGKEGNDTTASAQFFEAEHLSHNLYLRGYYRKQDNAFGLGQLSASLGATRKYGLDYSKTFENRLTIKGSAYKNDDLLRGVSEKVWENRLEIRQTLWSAYMGYRYADGSQTQQVRQILFGGEYALFDQRLKLRASHEQSLGSNRDNFFPTRTVLGVDFAVKRNMLLFGSYEWLRNDLGKSRAGRIGLRYQPWSGFTFENTTLSEFYNDTTRIYNTTGVVQNYHFNKHWDFSFGYEKGKLLRGELSGKAAPSLLTQTGNDAQREEFDAYRLGVNFHTKSWTALFNGEYRKGTFLNKRLLSGGIYSRLNPNFSFLFGADYIKSDDNRSHERMTTVHLSMAYRPDNGDLIVLDKLEAVDEHRGGLQEEMRTRKLINNLALNYKIRHNLIVSLQQGTKYVLDSTGTYDVKGWSYFAGFDIRWELTPKWMLGLQGSMLYVQAARNCEYAWGLYSAYNASTNLLAIAGYNFRGFEDRDFSLQNYRLQGPYVQLRMKFDQDSLRFLRSL